MCGRQTCQSKPCCRHFYTLPNFSCTFILLSVSLKCCFCCTGKAASVRKADMLVVLLRLFVVLHFDLNVPYSNVIVEKEICLENHSIVNTNTCTLSLVKIY